MSKAQLKKIVKIFNEKGLTKKELDRLEEDVLVIQKRLETGEYKVRSFSPKSSFDYQQRTEEFYTYLKDYCLAGQTFFRIFEKIAFKKPSKILELCPGWAPKVALGLYYLNFKGTFILADRNTESVQKLEGFMALFQTPYQIKQEKKDIFNLIGKFNWIVGNHILDDIILNQYCLENKIDPNSIYGDETAFQKHWKNILNKSEKIENVFIPRLARKIDILTQKGGQLILTQYQSMIERLLGMKELTLFNQKQMKNLKKELSILGWIDQKELVETALSGFKGFFTAKDCLMMEKA